jgi:hypothetical protein
MNREKVLNMHTLAANYLETFRRQMIISEDPLDLNTFGPLRIMLAVTLTVLMQGCDFSVSSIIE